MRTVVTLAAALLLGMGHAANVDVVKWYGAQYATAEALRAADAGLAIKRDASGWTVTYKGRTLVMLDGNTRGTLDGQQINIGSPSRVIDGVAYLPFDDLLSLLGVLGLQANLTQTKAAATPITYAPTPAPQSAPAAAAAPASEALYRVVVGQNPGNWDTILARPSYSFDVRNTNVTAETVYKVCFVHAHSRLKYPDQSRFDGPATVVSYPYNMWYVRGSVTAPNAYGVMKTGSYDCFIRANRSLMEGTIDFIGLN
ncbi:hypothetical protein DM785_02255 [Deinococcus actinosclerus]|nr:hypothetical protein DM785_02255 [Deinococcus actinosclerus]